MVRPFTARDGALRASLRQRNLKMVNRRASIYLENTDGTSEDYADDTVCPFDLEQEVIDIPDGALFPLVGPVRLHADNPAHIRPGAVFKSAEALPPGHQAQEGDVVFTAGHGKPPQNRVLLCHARKIRRGRDIFPAAECSY